jgi:hypothetical protein
MKKRWIAFPLATALAALVGVSPTAVHAARTVPMTHDAQQPQAANVAADPQPSDLVINRSTAKGKYAQHRSHSSHSSHRSHSSSRS